MSLLCLRRTAEQLAVKHLALRELPGGEVALVASSTVLSGTCPTDPLIVDFLGYNTTATCAETTPIAPLTNTTAAIRKNNGCTDTNNNSNDFLIDGPIPLIAVCKDTYHG